MFLHTHKNISQLFNGYSHRLQELGPINICGISGVGKLFYIKEYIRNIECECDYAPFLNISEPYVNICGCRRCEIIKKDCAEDVLILEKCGSIGDMRDIVNCFVDSKPLEFEYRYLIVRNLQMFTNNELDVLLNILEEPPEHLKIFVTSINLDGVSDPINSRLQCFNVEPLSKEVLKYLVESSTELMPYTSVLSKYDFNSIDKIIFYNKFSFENRFEKLFVKVESSYDLEVEIDDFLRLIGEQTLLQESEIIEFFLEFYVKRLNEFIELNGDRKNIVCFGEFLNNKLIPLYSNSLFKYVYLRKQYYSNLKYQMFLFFNTIFITKKIVGV